MTPDEILNRIKVDPDNVRLYQELARAYLEAGEEEKARALAIRRLRMPSEAAQIHRVWGEICEELGLAKQSLESYERALRLQPQDSETLYRLASLLADIGQYEKSLHHLKNLVRRDSNHLKARELLAENYRLLGLAGQAEVLCPKPVPTQPTTPLRYFSPVVSDQDANLLLRLFAGREVGFALQQLDAKTSDLSYIFQDKALNGEAVCSHLKGELTLAVFPLRSDMTVRYAAILLRLPTGLLEANLKNIGYLTLTQEKMRHHLLLMARYAAQFGISAYPEDSGNFTYRLWFFFCDFIHFLKVKRFIQLLPEKMPVPEGHIIIEPILATKPVGLGWTEHPITLPLGLQRNTLKHSFFLDGEGKPFPEQLKFLKSIREVSLKTVNATMRGLKTQTSGEFRREGDSKPLPETIKLLARKCSVLRELCRKATSGKVLRREEKVILFYTVGLADVGGEALHSLFEACPDYNYENVKRQASRLKPNPVSCPKIRELIPETTASVSCCCDFDLRGGKYPSPLLHLNPHLVPVAEELLVPDDIPFKAAVKRYVNLRLQQVELNRAMAKLETILNDHFAKAKINSIKSDGLILFRIGKDGLISWEMRRE